jgi:hypothetical protein
MTALSPARTRALAGPTIILFAALIASMALVIRGASCGHDFDFHLISWLDALHSWRQGILYPHWAPSANYGAGEPRFVFYPPLTWMAGALLRVLLPWKGVPAALTFLMLFAAGLATRALARQTLPGAPATFAGCVAIFSGYTLFTAYERAAFGELTGSIWMPLLLLLLLRECDPAARGWRRAFDGSATLLALVVAGAWFSDAPLGVIVCYTLAGLALAAALLRRSWAPILRASAATILGIGLASVYIVPADIEQPWVAIHQITDDPGYLIENNWLFSRHSGADMQYHDAELLKVSVISLSMLVIALACAAVLVWRSTPATRRQWWILFTLIPLAVFFLQLPISLPVWNLLPKLRYLQFPWRWLVVLEAPMSIVFAGVAWQLRRRWRLALLIACGCAATLVTVAATFGLVFYQDCDEDDSVRGVVTTYYVGDGFQGMDEYAPPGVDNSIAPLSLPMACLSPSPTTVLGQGSGGVPPEWSADQGACQATYDAERPTREASEHLRIHAAAPHAGYLILRLRRFPAWQVRVNGVLQRDLPQRDDGLIAVPVPQGPVNVAVDWTTTRDVLAGRWLTALSFLLLVSLWLVERRRTAPQVS